MYSVWFSTYTGSLLTRVTFWTHYRCPMIIGETTDHKFCSPIPLPTKLYFHVPILTAIHLPTRMHLFLWICQSYLFSSRMSLTFLVEGIVHNTYLVPRCHWPPQLKALYFGILRQLYSQARNASSGAQSHQGPYNARTSLLVGEYCISR
jgi:hypothetical protein